MNDNEEKDIDDTITYNINATMNDEWMKRLWRLVMIYNHHLRW